MRTEVIYKSKTFGPSLIKNVELDVNASLSGRVLDVDTTRVDVATGEEHLRFFSSEPLLFHTRDELVFRTSEDTSIGAWDQSSPLTLLRGGSQYAIAYPSAVTREQRNVYGFDLTSSLGRLSQMPHRGGVYNRSTDAGDLIREICGYQNGSPTAVTVFVAAAFEHVALYGWLPNVSPSGEDGAATGSAKDNLMQVLFALNATVRDDANGMLRVENLSTAVKSSLTAGRIYDTNPRVIDDTPVTSVTVLEHQYTPGGGVKVLFDGTTVAGQVIPFDEPCSGLIATGFTITESGANYAIVSAGSGTLTGVPYIHTTREITRAVSNSDTPNPVRVEDATLVGVTNSADVANRLAAYYACRKRIECDALIEYEDAGDVVQIYDPFDKVMREACIESISPLQVSNVMMGRISALVGFTPWQTVPFEDERELLTGSGTWTVPDDVTFVTVVLIGGGTDGTAGTGGQATGGMGSGNTVRDSAYGTGTLSVSVNASSINPGVGYPPAGTGGTGGTGGAGGESGKILRIEFEVTPGDTIAYSCGDTSTARDTEFGSYSSTSGEVSLSGYFDPIASIAYGVPGANGENGGNGGNGSSDGGSTTGAQGGKGYVKSAEKKNGSELTASFSSSNGGGGGAGGSSGSVYGRNGGPANNSDQNYARASGDSAQVIGYAANGGTGGNGANGADATTYGSGGGGGGGGGGAGACGSANVSATYTRTVYSATTLSLSGRVSAAYNRAGGTGGTGGKGMPGCVIIYYRKPVEE